MRYALDTDTIIYLRKGNWQVENHIARHAARDIVTTTISRGELYYGACHSDHPQANLRLLDALFTTLKALPFCDTSARIFGQKKAELRKGGQLIDDMDLMIACIALANRLTLVTNNTRHFARIKELKLANWLKA